MRVPHGTRPASRHIAQDSPQGAEHGSVAGSRHIEQDSAQSAEHGAENAGHTTVSSPRPPASSSSTSSASARKRPRSSSNGSNDGFEPGSKRPMVDLTGSSRAEEYLRTKLELRNAQNKLNEARMKSPYALRVKEVVGDLLERVRAGEPAITEHLESITGKQNARLIGLENRLKTEESLSRKIADRASKRVHVGRAESFESAVNKEGEQVNDVLRYTAEYPSAQYSRRADDMMNELKNRGYQRTWISNAWTSDSSFGGTYRGINATFKSPTGVLFELQLHTPESFKTKTNIHRHYEEARASSTEAGRRAELMDMMKRQWDEVETPPGASEIK